MTRGQIRALWRRHVRDTAGVEWDDTEANEIINLAYGLVQKEIVKIDRTAHVFWDYIPTTAGTSWYELPSSFGIIRVGLKTNTADLAWTKLDPKGYNKLQEFLDPLATGAQVSATGRAYYTVMGTVLGIFPAPKNSVSDGLQLIHTPLMSLGGDSEVPRVKIPLHLLIVYWAKLIALGDTDESSGETRDRIREMLDDLPLWYDLPSEADSKFEVQGLINKPTTQQFHFNDVNP